MTVNPNIRPDPERMGLNAIRQAIEDRDALGATWDALRDAGITANGTKTCADGVRELAGRLKARQ